MPERIQLKRTKGWRMPANTVKVDRTSKTWGNPFKVCEHTTAAESVMLYQRYIDQSEILQALARHELAGKNLACWCKPGTPCHADVLIKVANEKRPD
jgi:hypothetical protein